jgi:hypothetical protein
MNISSQGARGYILAPESAARSICLQTEAAHPLRYELGHPTQQADKSTRRTLAPKDGSPCVGKSGQAGKTRCRECCGNDGGQALLTEREAEAKGQRRTEESAAENSVAGDCHSWGTLSAQG